MGGHGGLNILPQKKWNVYNFDNREKVRLDEEAAAKEEQLKREQSRKRDSELRLEKLRQARGLATVSSAVDPNKPSPPIQTLAPPEQKSEADSRHINLFEGIRIFDPIKVGEEGRREEKKGKFWRESKKVKKEEVRAVGPEDDKYRVGYGIAGKGVKLPWYMEKRAARAKSDDNDDDSDDCCDYDDVMKSSKKRKAGGKKSLEELREERLKRESAEKQRERALIIGRSRRDVSAARDLGFSGRRRR